MNVKNIFQLRKAGHLILIASSFIYIIASFIPSLDRYFFFFQLILFAEGLALLAQGITGAVRLNDKREWSKVTASALVIIVALCVGGIDNSKRIFNIPAWLYIYYFVGYIPVLIHMILFARIFRLKSYIQAEIILFSVIGMVTAFSYFFLYAQYHNYIAYSLLIIGGHFRILDFPVTEFITQACIMIISFNLANSEDRVIITDND